jgi:hypothetical protein
MSFDWTKLMNTKGNNVVMIHLNLIGLKNICYYLVNTFSIYTSICKSDTSCKSPTSQWGIMFTQAKQWCTNSCPLSTPNPIFHLFCSPFIHCWPQLILVEYGVIIEHSFVNLSAGDCFIPTTANSRSFIGELVKTTRAGVLLIGFSPDESSQHFAHECRTDKKWSRH